MFRNSIRRRTHSMKACGTNTIVFPGSKHITWNFLQCVNITKSKHRDNAITGLRWFHWVKWDYSGRPLLSDSLGICFLTFNLNCFTLVLLRTYYHVSAVQLMTFRWGRELNPCPRRPTADVEVATTTINRSRAHCIDCRV